MGKNNKHIRLIIALFFVLSVNSQFANGQPLSLGEYRDAMGSRDDQDNKAAKRVEHIRKLLGTDKYFFAAPSDPNGPFIKYDRGTDIGNKESISVLYKSFLEKEIFEMREIELRDKPPTFDPSLTFAEQKASIDGIRKKYCLENFTPKFSRLSNQISSMKKNHLNARGVRDALVPIAKSLNDDRKNLINEYLKAAKLSEAVGDVVDVTFVDGYVYNLWIQPRGKGSEVKIPYNLSSLINFRTRFDKYFILIQGCFGAYIEDRFSGKISGVESIELLNDVKSIASVVYQGSRAVYATYDALNKKQIDLMIDLFLQMRRSDVPTDEEMTAQPIEGWNSKKNPSVVTYIEKKMANEQTKNVDTLAADFRYYRMLHRQLYDLEDFLTEEKSPGIKEKK